MATKTDDLRLRSVAYHTRKTLQALFPGDRFTTAELVGLMPINSRPEINSVSATLSKLRQEGFLTAAETSPGRATVFQLVKAPPIGTAKARPVYVTKSASAAEQVEPDPDLLSRTPEPAITEYTAAPAQTSQVTRNLELAMELVKILQQKALTSVSDDALWEEMARRRIARRDASS